MEITGDPVERVFQALIAGALSRDDLTARRIAAFLGQSTTVLYHHYGSLDGFLIRVDGAGWKILVEHLRRHEAEGASLDQLAGAYLDFAFRHPDLYWLMTTRPFDRVALRGEDRLSLAGPLLHTFSELLRRHGSQSPIEDTYALFAGLHGLAALTSSGRVNIHGKPGAEEAIARATARRLVKAIVPGSRPPAR